MANHVSAIKRNKQNQRRRLINQMNRQKLKTQLKKLKAAEGQSDEAQAVLSKTLSVIDRSVQKGVIKANAARRYKSRINRRVNAVPA